MRVAPALRLIDLVGHEARTVQKTGAVELTDHEVLFSVVSFDCQFRFARRVEAYPPGIRMRIGKIDILEPVAAVFARALMSRPDPDTISGRQSPQMGRQRFFIGEGMADGRNPGPTVCDRNRLG